MPEIGRGVPLYFLTGFLGAGKTTLLNRLIDLLPEKRIGVLVNDFGELDVDGSLLTQTDQVQMVELNGGQIFCSCLSGSFVESMCAYQDVEIDYFFVECSGLAKPAPMMDILGEVLTRTGNAFDYRGMICVVDAESYEDLSDVVNAVNEQVQFSDLFLLNKTDLVPEAELQQIEEQLQVLRPGVAVQRTVYSRVDASILELQRIPARLTDAELATYSGWGAPGRPVPLSVVLEKPVGRQQMMRFLHRLVADTYRVKGIVQGDGELLQVDCVGERVVVHRYVGHSGPIGIFVVSRIGAALQEKLTALVDELL